MMKKMFSWKELTPMNVEIVCTGSPVNIPMQFTGLLDKNGKEIYEGDIVFAEEYVGFKNLKAEVIYNRGRFCLNTGTIPEDLIAELCEVIGNIYSNPELLKQ